MFIYIIINSGWSLTCIFMKEREMRFLCILDDHLHILCFAICSNVILNTLMAYLLYQDLLVAICDFRYNANKFTTGGMAVVEFGVPTGFMAELESDVTKLVGVQKTEIIDQKIMLYFDEVSYTSKYTQENKYGQANLKASALSLVLLRI